MHRIFGGAHPTEADAESRQLKRQARDALARALRSASPPRLSSPKELDGLWEEAQQSGAVDGAVAVAFFSRTGLPSGVLARIWCA